MVKESSPSQAAALPPGDTKRPLGARIFLAVLAMVLGWHVFATFVWGSGNLPVQNAVGTQNLSSYMLPMFNQAWNVFAPDPEFVDARVLFRATLRDRQTGAERVSEFVNISQHDIDSSIRSHPIPSKLIISSFGLAATYSGDFATLSAEQKKIFGQNFDGEDWPQQLIDHLAQAPDAKASGAYTGMARTDQALVMLSTNIAQALWPEEEIISVQTQHTQQNVPNFEDRGTDKRATPSVITSGWRSPLPSPGIDLQVYRDYVQGMPTQGASR